MEQIAKAFNTLFTKLSDFFDILDLSFIISGAASVGAIWIWYFWKTGEHIHNINSTFEIITLIIACYISGLICFATGRWMRHVVGRQVQQFFYKKDKIIRFEHRFKEVVEAHGLIDTPEVESYFKREDKRGPWRLYIRMWAYLRHQGALSNSLSLAKRYWVLAATYDGLSTVIVIWLFLFMDVGFDLSGSFKVDLFFKKFAPYYLPVLALAFYVCLREANRYFYYQVEEVVASVADNYIEPAKQKPSKDKKKNKD